MKKYIKELIPYLVIIVIVVLIRTFIVTPAIVDGNSMEPTLKNNEVVIVNKIVKRVKGVSRFDIVVVNYNKEKLVKRIIGMPGEIIEYKNDKLYIDNNEITNINYEYTKDFNYVIPENEYFVMGDNRNVSKDSRSFGSVKKKNILGIVNIIIFPVKKIGRVE